MQTKLWLVLSLSSLGCGGRVVDMGTVVDTAPEDAGGTSVSGGVPADGAVGSFTHELVQFAGWTQGMCALFSDEIVRCWKYGETTAREVPDLRGVAIAGDPFDSVDGSRICVVGRSGTLACRDNKCQDGVPCWFSHTPFVEMVGVESAVSTWMWTCRGVMLRADGLLQQWKENSISCSSPYTKVEAPVSFSGYQSLGSPIANDEPIARIPTQGSFGYVTQSGKAFHTRFRPTAEFVLPSDQYFRYAEGWPPAEVPGVDDAVEITSTSESIAVFRKSGKISAYGVERSLGIGSDQDVVGSGEVLIIDDAVAIASGRGTCAIRRDRSLWCWGSSWYGELGVFGPPNGFGEYVVLLSAPTKFPDVQDVRAVGMTDALTCTVHGKNEVWCRGFGSPLSRYRVSFQ